MRLFHCLLFFVLSLAFVACAESSSGGEFNLELAADAGIDAVDPPEEMPDDAQGCLPE